MYLNQQGFKIFSPSTWRASSRHPPASHFKVLFTAGNWLFSLNYWTVINSQFVHCYCFLMFNHTLWILGKEKKLLATPLSLLIPKVIPASGTVIWETDLVLSHYSNSCRWILLAPWSSGRYRASREIVRLSSLLSLFGKGRDETFSSLLSLLSQHRHNPHGKHKMRLRSHLCLSLSSSLWDPGGWFSPLPFFLWKLPSLSEKPTVHSTRCSLPWWPARARQAKRVEA